MKVNWSIDPLAETKQYVSKNKQRFLLSRSEATEAEVYMWKLLMEAHEKIPLIPETTELLSRIDDLVGECVRVQKSISQ